ncbi:MAG: glycosyltransferase, partial [Candidatus Izemoplasmatales bacterium]|nr:glycosyltransferase [Candidatus Izemoplasmatales bacterium]
MGVKLNNDGIDVILFNDTFFPAIDGTIRVVDNYAKTIMKQGSVLVVAPKFAKEPTNIEYPVMRTASLRFLMKDFALGIRLFTAKDKKRIKEAHADIYHAHSPFIIGHFALREAKRNHVPIVTTFHSKLKDDFYQYTKSKFLTNILMRYILRFYNSVDAIWACSESTAKLLKSYGITKPITVMENGTDFIYPDDVEGLIAKTRSNFQINT